MVSNNTKVATPLRQAMTKAAINRVNSMVSNKTMAVAILKIKTSARPAVRTLSALHLMAASNMVKQEANMVNMMPAIHRATPAIMVLKVATPIRRTKPTSNSGRRVVNKISQDNSSHMAVNINSPNNPRIPTLPTMTPMRHR